MTEISGKSLHEIYKEDARKYKESVAKELLYSESADNLIGNFDKTESLTVTMPMEEFDKLQKLALSAHTDKLSVEKLQEQLNTAKKALTEISVIPTKFDDGGAGEIAVEIAHEALAVIGNEGSGDE